MTNEEIRGLFCLDKAHFAMIDYALSGESTKILYADKDGLLLTRNGIDMIYGATDEGVAERVLRLLPHTDMIVCSSQTEVSALKKVFPEIKTAKPCYQVRYEFAAEKPPIAGAEIRPLPYTEENADAIFATYSLGYDRDSIVNLLKTERFFGAYLNGKLAGYIGRHEEGSIGLLEVFPDARGTGLGSALLCAAVKDVLSHGEIAYSNIITTNEASLKLHAKLGYFPSDKLVYWCY